jgi:hypothetical protein
MADAGNGHALEQLAVLAAERGDLDELRAMADAGHSHAADQLIGVLVERGDLEGIRREMYAGTKGALEALRLAEARRTPPPG